MLEAIANANTGNRPESYLSDHGEIEYSDFADPDKVGLVIHDRGYCFQGKSNYPGINMLCTFLSSCLISDNLAGNHQARLTWRHQQSPQPEDALANNRMTLNSLGGLLMALKQIHFINDVKILEQFKDIKLKYEFLKEIVSKRTKYDRFTTAQKLVLVKYWSQVIVSFLELHGIQATLIPAPEKPSSQQFLQSEQELEKVA
ncbi:hypothetical protein GYA49_00415 [Candidatus Beckwithbacteria bacterium]|nr:hypothetical protein [Candidatus Beckwithbacteria bacterium]